MPKCIKKRIQRINKQCEAQAVCAYNHDDIILNSQLLCNAQPLTHAILCGKCVAMVKISIN